VACFPHEKTKPVRPHAEVYRRAYNPEIRYSLSRMTVFHPRVLFLALVVALAATGFAAVYAQEAVREDRDRPPMLPEVVVTAEAPQPGAESADGPSDFPFTSPLVDGYLSPSTTTGTKINVPQIDFPGSVETITRDIIDDQEGMKFFDVTHNVSGVYLDDGAGGIHDSIIVRGFTIEGNSSDFRKNGFRDNSRVQRDMANIQRIEILKGAASVLYGASGQPYGVVNFITKKPLDFYYREPRVQFGSWDNYRFTFDTTGPYNGDPGALYRANFAVQDSGSFRNFVYTTRFFISPVVTYRLDPDTTLTFETEWLHDRRMPDRGIPYYNNSFQNVPISMFTGESYNRNRVDDGQVGIFLNRWAYSDLAWRAGYVSNWSDESRYVVEGRGDRVRDPNTNPHIRRRLKDDHTVDSDHFFIGDVMRDFYTGRIEHHLVYGTELGTSIRHKKEDSRTNGVSDFYLAAPVYGDPQPPPNRHRDNDVQNNQYGIYAQDLIDVAPRLKALAGVRWDAYNGRNYDTRRLPAQRLLYVNEHVWSPRFGLVLQPIEDVFSIYTGYSKSFEPQVGVSRLGTPFVPETGEMYEVGVKLDLLDGQLFINIAGFDTFRENMLVTDVLDPDYDIQIGEAESKGGEFDMVGRLTDRWSIVANCAYIDVRITQDDDGTLVDHRLPNVPYFGASVWTRYNFIQDYDRTFGAAVGVIYRGFRQGDVENTYQLPGYTRWDAGVYYDYGRWEFALVAENLLDEFYIAAGKGQVSNIPGAPFNVIGSACLVY